ncbi:MAG: flippase [bacterium]|nr:flippase [bacterium]
MFKQIAYNTGINFAAKIISTALGLAAVAMMTRYLGALGFGQYTTIIIYLQFFAIAADLGLTLITSQLLAKYQNKENEIINNLFTFRLLSALLFLAPAPIIVLFLPYAAAVKTGIFIATASFLFIALNQIFVGFYQKRLLMAKASIAEVGGRLILVLGIFTAIYLNSGLRGVVVATVLAALIHFLINYVLALPDLKLRLAYDKTIWSEIMKLSWPLALTISFNLIYLKADTLILSLLKPETDVGLYGASYRVIDVLVTMPFILAGIVLPQITAAWHGKNLAIFKKLIQHSFDIMVIIALPLMVGAQFVANDLMRLVAGEDFAASGPILKLLIIAAGIIYLGTIFSHVIISLERQKQTIWAYVVVAITSLIGYLVFIPKYSYFGAAAVTIYSESLIAVLIFGITYYYIKFIPNFIMTLKSLAACAVMALGLYYLNLTLMPALLMAVIIYAAILILLAHNDFKKMI